jgi:hypothetical protein
MERSGSRQREPVTPDLCRHSDRRLPENDVKVDIDAGAHAPSGVEPSGYEVMRIIGRGHRVLTQLGATGEICLINQFFGSAV